MTAAAETAPMDQLDALESEAIHVIREVAGEFDRPVILFSGGKDSMLLVHLARKAFWPAPIPFPVLHVDTGHNFDEVLSFRDAVVERYGLELEVARVQDYIDDGRLEERADGTRNPLQTTPLLDAISEHRHDAVFGGGRRDEERARAKERVFSHRDMFGQWDPRNQRPEPWSIYNTKLRKGEHFRVFPLSNWTEVDVWSYIQREGLRLPSIYFAHEREVFVRDGLYMAAADYVERLPGEEVITETVRFRTVGDVSCTGALKSSASTVEQVLVETRASDVSERGASRADDKTSEAAMEDRKRGGYF
jgi:sulfate adenylyltransferase subunit 2